MKKTAILLLALLAALTLTFGLAQRGSSGQVNIIYWQAVSILNPYLSGGTKDIEAASLVLEPLAHFDPDGNLVPVLVDEIPTVDNGGVAEDLLSITWKLKEGILWSDGTPFTADDVVFTYDYCLHPDMGCSGLASYVDVDSVEALDELTVRVNFSSSKPFPYGPFVGSNNGAILQRAQFEDCLGARAPECTEENFGPIGTGPFAVSEFRANDVVIFEANENYRDPERPFFQTVVFKGGGDSASAARAVLETGEFDYAWNVQVEPEIVEQMMAAGRGTVVTSFGPSVERLMVNLTNPDPALGENRSVYMGGDNAHPFLSEQAVRRALSLAIDRQILVDVGYGVTGQPTCNILPAPAIYASNANNECLTQNIEEANNLLDAAGWERGSDGIREKDGVRLSILYQTSTNSVRQDTQALIKQMWEQIGVETELRNIDAAVFFGGDPASPDTYQKFYADIEMYTNSFNGTDPENYMANWTCDNIPGPDTGWQGDNIQRSCTEEYDALVLQLSQTAGLEARAELARLMNDQIVQSYWMIPLIWRGDVAAVSNTLEGVAVNSWDSEIWEIANWRRVE
ncbi:MAG: peptide ABC transporter substrate-binding protein [Trueperaceae bacterium]|nr:MAG: peptide ABC transporter substrate-binding protein [Trueperaceae bacterium]